MMTKICSALAIAAGVLAMIAGSAGATTVVPPNGTLADHTYSQWNVKWWKLRFAKPVNASPCQQENGVEVLIGIEQHERATCRIPAGRPVYDTGPGSECSNIEDPPFYGATATSRKRCAKRNDRVRSYSLKLDGRRIRVGDPDSGPFVNATPDFQFTLAKNNILGSDKPGGRSSAYGLGVGFRHLAAGPHLIRARIVFADGTTFTQRYRLVVPR